MANISGGHINPWVIFAALFANNIIVARRMMYVAAQLLGAIVGALLLLGAIPEAADTNLGSHALGADVSVGMGLLMEITLTFVLVFVIFGTAADPGGVGPLAPMAIGLAALVGHLVVPITGVSINPARSLGPALVARQGANHWVC